MLPLPAGGAPHLFLLALLAALAGGVSAVDRKGAFQLMLSRPIVLAPAIGLLLGDARGGLFIGLPLELLFLGGVNLGGSLPDNESLLAGALASMLVPAGLALRTGVDAPLLALGVAPLFPLALYGRRLERASELRNAALFAEALARVERGDAAATRINLRGLLLPFSASAGICALCVLLSPLLAFARLRCSPALLPALSGAFQGVFLLAAASAVRAIRDARAPLIAGVSAAAVLLVKLLW